MGEIFILNESRQADLLGDMQLFDSLDALTNYTEAIDVLAGEYYAFSSKGEPIQLFAEGNDGIVNAVRQTATEQDIVTVRKLLLDYILWWDSNSKLSVEQAMDTDLTIRQLIELLPSTAIQTKS